VRISVAGRELSAARLAVYWMTGVYPTRQVVHINGRRDDNRWSNLLKMAPRSRRRRDDSPSSHAAAAE
jgi:hypothetical protein